MSGEDRGSLDAMKKLVRPNAKFSVENSERLGLYVLLYNEILGDLKDYQGDRLSLDVLVNDRIQNTMKMAKKIYQNRAMGVSDSEGIDTSSRDYEFALRWMKNILPVQAGIQKDVDGSDIYIGRDRPLYDTAIATKNAAYVDAFLKSYETVKGEEKYIASMLGKDVLTLKDGMLYLAAKREKISELYEYYRSNSDYKPGKIDKDGNSKSGVHATEFFNAQNKLHKMRRSNRRHLALTVFKGAVATGFAALTVVSAGALLSYGGFALTAMFGTAFSAAGVGAAALGAVGTLFGFFGAKNMFKRTKEGIKKALKNRREMKDFLGEKFRGKDLERFLGAIKDKDGKNLTYHEKEVLFKFSKAARQYFEKKGGKDDPEFPQELKKYLPDSIIKEYKLDKEKQRWEFVNNKQGAFANLMNNYTHVVDSLAMTDDQGKPTKRENRGEAMKLVENAGTIKDIIEANKYITSYQGNIAPEHVTAMQQQLGNKLIDAVRTSIFEDAYDGNTYSNMSGYTKRSDIGQIFEYSTHPNAKGATSDALRLLKTEKDSGDSPLNEDIGVSVVEQLSYDQGSMEAACLSLTNGSSQADVDDAIRRISTMQTKDEYDDIDTIVTRLETNNQKVGNYLRHMLEKKKAASVNSEDRIAMDIDGVADASMARATTITLAQEIKSIARNDKGQFVSASGLTLQQIRESLTDPAAALTPGQQKTAAQLLDTHVSSLERQERDTAREDAVTIIQNGDYSGLEEDMDTISKLTLETIDGVEVRTFFEKKVSKGVMKDYLTIQFKNKIEKLFDTEISNKTKYSGNGEGILKNITTKLQEISANRYLDDAQKTRLTKKLTENLDTVLGRSLKQMEINFLSKLQKGDIRLELDNYLNGDYGDSGLREFFAKKSPESEAIKQRIERLQKGMNIVDLLSAKVSIGPVVEDVESLDTKLFTYIYFGKDDRTNLVSLLTDMDSCSNSAQVSEFTQTGPKQGSDTDPSFIYNMNKIINSPEIAALDPEEQLAALLVAKKRCIAAFKLNMQQYKAAKCATGGSLDTFFGSIIPGTTTTGAADFSTNVINKWNTYILADLDAKINALLVNNRVKKICSDFGGYGYTGAQSIVGKSTRSGADVYMASDQMSR